MKPSITTELEKSFLLDQFRDFYKEIMVCKEKVSESDSGIHRDPGYEIREELTKLLKKQETEAQQYGKGYGLSFYEKAQFVMAALADEIFIHDVRWDVSEAWKDDLLEFRLFHSNSAGEYFFQRADDLLREADPRTTEIAAVYFLALSLGFKGKYRDYPDSRELMQHRERLFRFIFHKNSDSDPGRLFPQTYQHNLSEGGNRRLSYLKYWLYGIAGSFLGILIISYFIWSNVTGELMQIVESIGKAVN